MDCHGVPSTCHVQLTEPHTPCVLHLRCRAYKQSCQKPVGDSLTNTSPFWHRPAAHCLQGLVCHDASPKLHAVVWCCAGVLMHTHAHLMLSVRGLLLLSVPATALRSVVRMCRAAAAVSSSVCLTLWCVHVQGCWCSRSPRMGASQPTVREERSRIPSTATPSTSTAPSMSRRSPSTQTSPGTARAT